VSDIDRDIRRNVVGNNRYARLYDSHHPEIFTPIEQARLRATLQEAAAAAGPDPTEMRALDFGCGSGNLTRHLLDMGLEVAAADVADKFLRIVEKRWSDNPRLTTVQLDGRDLRVFPDSSFDLVATYSVLHHLPDYLGALSELARVLRPGGVIYLDHEASDGYWLGDPVYDEFVAAVTPPPRPRNTSFTKYLDPRNYYRRGRELLVQRYHQLAGHNDQGDLHCYPEDHIEWSLVQQRLENLGLDVVFGRSYLLYRDGYPMDVFEAYQDRCSDVYVLAMKKLDTD
jgi:ubiquinone/menaquinone biosynthesis C-methylase UbiE